MDFEDQVLAGFVLLIAALGGGGCYYNGDVVAVWECLSIVYLLLYLALERLFDKTDQVTGMPNRNAFTLAYFRETRHPAPVLLLTQPGGGPTGPGCLALQGISAQSAGERAASSGMAQERLQALPNRLTACRALVPGQGFASLAALPKLAI